MKVRMERRFKTCATLAQALLALWVLLVALLHYGLVANALLSRLPGP